MGNLSSSKNDWRCTATFTGSTNCKEEQECEITLKMFTETPETIFKVKARYAIVIWEVGNYHNFMFIRNTKKPKKLFSLPKTIKLFSI